MSKHTATTDGNTLWVNSWEKCIVRISGLDKLKGMESVDAMASLSLDGMMDVIILDKPVEGGEDSE